MKHCCVDSHGFSSLNISALLQRSHGLFGRVEGDLP